MVLGSARDIVELCGVPRLVFNDFPLGNPMGVPGDTSMQQRTLEYGFELLESALHPRTTMQTPFVWPGENDWRESYARVKPAELDRLRQMGEERRAFMAQAKATSVHHSRS